MLEAGFPVYDRSKPDASGISDEGMQKAFPQPPVPAWPAFTPHTYTEAPMGESELPRDLINALQVRQVAHKELRKRQSKNREQIADLRTALQLIQSEPEDERQAMSARVQGLLTRGERIDRTSRALAEALAEKNDLARDLRESDAELKALDAKVRALGTTALQSLAKESDAHLMQAEALGKRADRTLAELADVGVHFQSGYEAVDPNVWGSFSNVRLPQVIEPSGRRTQMIERAGASDYRIERKRKLNAGVLKEVAS